MEGSKVELHVHLDSAWRHSTLWDLARKRNIKIAGIECVEDLTKACIVDKPLGLHNFLKPHQIISPIYSGYLEGAERLAYEYCEDVARVGVVYAEVRFSPQRLLGHQLTNQLGFEGLREVVKRVAAGLVRGEEDFGVQTRMILIAIYQDSDWDMSEVLRLCQTNWDRGVVGLDLCTLQPEYGIVDEAPLVQPVQTLMDEARRCGVYRTIHAGEVSGPAAIERAVYGLLTNRVGHGYHVVDDTTLYTRCLNDRVHFECCPYSSFLTGAVPTTANRHPILRFAEDGANFSLNSDDPTMTGHYVDGDYRLASSFGLTDQHLVQANINAAKASFLQDSEKTHLVRKINKSYGLEE